jgi:hypothetical protein
LLWRAAWCDDDRLLLLLQVEQYQVVVPFADCFPYLVSECGIWAADYHQQ